MDGGRGLLPPVFPNLSIPDSANSRYSSFVIFSTVLSIFRALRFHLGYQRERQRKCPPRLYQSRDSIPRFHVLYDDIFYSMYQSWAPASRFALTRHWRDDKNPTRDAVSGFFLFFITHCRVTWWKYVGNSRHLTNYVVPKWSLTNDDIWMQFLPVLVDHLKFSQQASSRLPFSFSPLSLLSTLSSHLPSSSSPSPWTSIVGGSWPSAGGMEDDR